MRHGVFADCLVVAAACGLAGCAYSKKLEKPLPLLAAAAIGTSEDGNLAASIDALIVRDGPGSWSRNADWDEYRVRVDLLAGEPLEFTNVVVVDSLGNRHEPDSHRTRLAKQSRKTLKRYEDRNVEVTAGGGADLFFGGWVVGEASAMAGMATLGSSAVANGAAAAGALVAAPVLMVAGAVVGVQGYQVQREIKRRSTVLPLQVTAGPGMPLDLFFPIAPAPDRLEVHYVDGAGSRVLIVDTRAALAGLHLMPEKTAPDEAAPTAPE